MLNSETLVSDVKARAILGADYIRGQDYYLCTDDEGREWLQGWGEDEPAALNTTNTSWHSPGYPAGGGDA